MQTIELPAQTKLEAARQELSAARAALYRLNEQRQSLEGALGAAVEAVDEREMLGALSSLETLAPSITVAQLKAWRLEIAALEAESADCARQQDEALDACNKAAADMASLRAATYQSSVNTTGVRMSQLADLQYKAQGEHARMNSMAGRRQGINAEIGDLRKRINTLVRAKLRVMNPAAEG